MWVRQTWCIPKLVSFKRSIFDLCCALTLYNCAINLSTIRLQSTSKNLMSMSRYDKGAKGKYIFSGPAYQAVVKTSRQSNNYRLAILYLYY